MHPEYFRFGSINDPFIFKTGCCEIMNHKDRFIFSGSNKHLLLSIFSDYGRPFYSSTDFLELKRLDIDEYSQFIQKILNC